MGAVLPPFDAEPFSATGGLMRPEGACISDAGLRLPKTARGITLPIGPIPPALCDAVADRTGPILCHCSRKDPSLRTAEPSAGAAAEKDAPAGTSSARCSTHAASPACGFAGESISLAIRIRASGGRAYDAGIPPLFRSSVRPYAAHRPLSIVASEYAVTLPYFVADVKPPNKVSGDRCQVSEGKLLVASC